MENDIVLKRIKYIILGICVLAFQTGFADNIRILGVAPNIVLSYVICVSFRSSDALGFYNALIMGLCMDSLCGRVFGGYTFFFVAFDFLISKVFYKVFSNHFWFEFFCGVMLNAVFSFSYALVSWLFGENFWLLLVRLVLVEIAYNSFVFLVILFVFANKKKKRHITFRIDEDVFARKRRF